MKSLIGVFLVCCASALATTACGSADSSTSGSTDPVVKGQGGNGSTTTAQRCGGNMANAAQCPDGYQCMPEPGSTLPVGDVGGICEPSHCGGNMANALECTDGYECVPDPNSTLPFGDVGGICQVP